MKRPPLRSTPVNGHVQALFGDLAEGQTLRLSASANWPYTKIGDGQAQRTLDGAIVNLLPSVRVWVAQEAAL